MALNTYGKYQRKHIGPKDGDKYREWLEESGVRPACYNSKNPAYLSTANSTVREQELALIKCAGCPLLKGCNFFANTRLFKGNDAVMGGQAFREGRPAERVFSVSQGEIFLLEEYRLVGEEKNLEESLVSA